jgi:uncharacterized protein (DUF433 family)
MQDWQERVTINPDVCHGKVVLRFSQRCNDC